MSIRKRLLAGAAIIGVVMLGLCALGLSFSEAKAEEPVARPEPKAVCLVVTGEGRGNEVLWRLWSDGRVESMLPKPTGPGVWSQVGAP